MAENFQGQAGVSGGTWWNSPKEAFVSPCSLGIGVGTTPFGWQSMPETTPERKKAAKLQQREADSDSGSSSVTIDSTLQILGLRFSPSGNSPSAWNPPILQEDMNSSLVGTSQTGQGFIQTGFPINAQSIPSSYNFSSSSSPNLSTNLYDPTQSNNNNLPFLMNHNNYLSCPNDLPSPEILLNPSEIPNIPKQQAFGFVFPNNNAPFWSNSSTSALNNNGTSPTTGFVASSSQPALSTQFLPGQFQEKPMSCFKTSATSDVRHPKFVAMKIRTDEPATKKTRLATPSPLPSFKVRKANLRDQITALQQLVSPFGKTDTASVLQEAIEYIKFLHDQVNVLSTPYMKQGSSVQQQQNSNKPKDQEGNDIEQDLRSRGLCLVPISSTFPVANETNADLWTPSFG